MRLDELKDPTVARELLRRATRQPELQRLLRLDLSRVAAAACCSASTVARHLRGEHVRDDAAARINLSLGAPSA
jgi:hypothetical protein